MSRLEELIQQLCPDGVEYRKLGDICNVIRGKRLTTKELSESSEFPVYHGGITPIGYYSQFNRESYSTMIINVGASAGTVGFSYEKFWSSDGCFCFTHNELINQKYLFFVFQSLEYNIKSKVRKAGIPTLDNKDVECIIIPLPPLPVQEEIVRLLDQLTETTQKYQAELEAELELRKKQYEEYRNQLLDLEGKEGVEMKTLGEIGEFIRGNGIQKTDFIKEGFPCIHYGQIHTKFDLSTNTVISYIDKSLYTRCRKAETDDVILATTSEDVECVAKPLVWLGTEKVAISGDAYIFRHNQNGLFIAHQFMTHNFLLFKKKYATGTKVVRISGDNMAKFKFPLPSLAEQQRIVDILDRMDKAHKELCQSIEEEIKKRKQQYEYYRNQLLDFKKKES